MVFLSEKNETMLNQRKGKGIWQNLYEFPLIETAEEASWEELKETESFKTFSEEIKIQSVFLYNEKSICHKLSHQHLYARFWIVEVAEVKEKAVGFSKINNYAIPVLVENFVSDFPPFKLKKGEM